MKNCAIICEYNPFHNGHKFQIDYLKNVLGFDFVTIIMSGHFSQRAVPSVLDKYSRALMPQNCDLICQIPTAYSINNGEVFATAGIKIINSLNITHICFGVETPDKELFFSLADNLLNESNEYRQNLKNELKKGLSYKSANINSIKKSFARGEEYAKLLSTPNNILAFEYIKAIKKYNYNIEPIFLKRQNDYLSMTPCSDIASATMIRQNLSDNKDISLFVPDKSLEVLNKNYNPDYTKRFKNLVYISMLGADKERLKNTYNVTEGIENRIISALSSKDYDSLISNIVTKRYDLNKVNRILLCYMLGITNDVIKKLYISEPEYIKVLYINRKIIPYINTDRLILRKKDITPNIENNVLEQIENKSNIFARYIYNKDIDTNDIFIKPIIE